LEDVTEQTQEICSIIHFKIYNKEIEKWISDENANRSMQDVSSQLQLINSALHSLGRVLKIYFQPL
jgi:hypothetical protein